MMSNNMVRVSFNICCGVLAAWISLVIGSHIVETQPMEIYIPWSAFLALACASAWAWAFLASFIPDPQVARLKEVLFATSVAILSLFFSLALGITIVRLGQSDAVVAAGHGLIAAGLISMPWMLKKLGLI